MKLKSYLFPSRGQFQFYLREGAEILGFADRGGDLRLYTLEFDHERMICHGFVWVSEICLHRLVSRGRAYPVKKIEGIGLEEKVLSKPDRRETGARKAA